MTKPKPGVGNYRDEKADAQQKSEIYSTRSRTIDWLSCILWCVKVVRKGKLSLGIRYAHVDMEPSLQDSEEFGQLQAEFREVRRERDDLAARVCSLDRSLIVLTNELNASRRNPDRPPAAAVDDQITADDDCRLVAELESRLSDAEADSRRLCEVIVQLKAERAEMRMQQDELSDKLAESQQTVTQLEDDTRDLSDRLQGVNYSRIESSD